MIIGTPSSFDECAYCGAPERYQIRADHKILWRGCSACLQLTIAECVRFADQNLREGD